MKGLYSLHISFVLVLVSFFYIPLYAQTGEQYVKKMHTKYKDNWYRTLTFTQDTEFYRNDSVIRKSVWYEMVRFPYELRIDVDSINGGTKTIYKKDSTYRIRKNKIQAVNVDPNPFIFFLGGMYMLPLDSAISQLTRNGYDLSLGGLTDWKGRKTMIIGAANHNDTSRNQFWVDAKHLYIVRVRLKAGKSWLDVHLSDHVKLEKGWSETMVKFFMDGKLLQTEKYREIQPDAIISDELFDVSRFR